MRRSIATVSLAGPLEEKLRAAGARNVPVRTAAQSEPDEER